MHNESHIALGGRRQHTGRGKTEVVDEQGILVPFPRDGEGRVGYDQLKGLVVPVLGTEQGILPHDAELVKLNIMQEHIDAAKVVGGQVDFLAIEAPLNIVLAQHLFHLQQQRAGTAGRVIDLVDLRFSNRSQSGQQFGNIHRGEILSALFPALAAYIPIRYS